MKNDLTQPKFTAMKTLIICILFILLPLTHRAQDNLCIKGQITNGFNHMPLEDCHIYVDGQVTGTISNRYGEFDLEIPSEYQNRSINISYVGFETYCIPISEIQNNFLEVALMEEPICLDEIAIKPDYDFIEEAIISVKNEFTSEEDLLKAFYHALLKKDIDQTVIRTLLLSNAEQQQL